MTLILLAGQAEIRRKHRSRNDLVPHIGNNNTVHRDAIDYIEPPTEPLLMACTKLGIADWFVLM